VPSPWRIWTGLAIIYVVWGSTYLAIRVMVETVPALLGAGLRFTLAGACMLAFLSIRKGAGHIRVERRQLAAAALIGLLLPAGGNGLVTVAEKDVPSALAALLIAAVPLWVVIFRTIARDRVPRGTFWGVIGGFCGLAMLLLPGNRPDGATTIGLVLVVVASVSWAFGSFISPRVALPADPFVSTGWQMVCGGTAMIVGGLVSGEAGELHLGELSSRSLIAFAYLTTIGSIVAFSAYVWLLKNAPISKVATYAYVNPVVAVLLGWWLLDEDMTGRMLIAAAVIVASVAVIVRRESVVKEEPVRV
jgi:drug/metabolite transporter (DMT)-like permease